MIRFLVRRTATGLVVLLVSSFLMFGMLSVSINPLQDLEESTAPNKAQLIAQRIQELELDRPWIARFWDWLTGLLTGDLGVAWRSGRAVESVMGDALIDTLQLVTAATFLAIVLGVAIGIASALRQYSTFDYVITLASFVLFSLPSFWVAVLLKQGGAIWFNSFLAEPNLSYTTIIVVGLVTGLFWSLAVGGDALRRLVVAGVAAAASIAMFAYLQESGWWSEPHISGGLFLLLSLATAIVITLLTTGLSNRRALLTGVAVVVIFLLLHGWITEGLFVDLTDSMTWGIIGLFVLGAIALGMAVGAAFRGPDWGQSMRVGGMTGGIVMVFLVLDRCMQAWPAYFNANAISGRPIATMGSDTPNLGGNFWIQAIDMYTHLILPTLVLMLISFAQYTRYSRGSMLEVLGQDYMRTARAKGLNERTVIMRHGFRNTLIPLATIAPVDVITLFGGAIITEQIFGRPGMGRLFVDSLNGAEMDPLMAYIVLTAALAVLANIVADMLYAALDPRIRLS
ncbi:ABC transporter permease [Georgenia sp. Z1491]|uniref:ABC transporter permease n=1 Tax=Georgenia sp. Z1491 TaxID=3416707 RepID=UPI003CEF68AB